MDKDTILYLIAILGCVWGALSQIGGMKKAAQNEGRLFAELQACASGIVDIKKQINALRESLSKNITEIKVQDNRITVLESDIKELKKGGG